MAAPVTIHNDNPGGLPASYTVPPGLAFTIESVSVEVDGSGAAGAFYPCFAIYSQNGKLIGRYFPGDRLSAGDSAEITYGAPAGSAGGSGGSSSMAKVISAASTNATSVKSSPGKVTGWAFSNQNAAVRYLKLYNKASAPTVGTDIPVLTIAMPAGATGHVGFDSGPAFSAGIGLALTTGVADADTGAVAALDIVVNLLYQ